jgi:hypothetical protein
MPDEAELLGLVPGVEGWLAGEEPITPAVDAAAGRSRIISRNGSGTDNLPMEALDARGIHVTRAMAANATGVAELALGLILCASRHIHEVSRGVATGGWPRPKGREIEGASRGSSAPVRSAARSPAFSPHSGPRSSPAIPATPISALSPAGCAMSNCLNFWSGRRSSRFIARCPVTAGR